NIENCGAMAQSNVPNVNKPIAVIKRPRFVNLSIKNAVIGIIIPLTSINTDWSHCAVLSLSCKSSIIGGSAVPNKVWFNIVINAPDINTINNGRFFFQLNDSILDM